MWYPAAWKGISSTEREDLRSKFRTPAVQNSGGKTGHKQTGSKCWVQSPQYGGNPPPLWKACLIQTWIPALHPLCPVLFVELPGPSEENSIRYSGEEGEHKQKVHLSLSQLWKKSLHRLSNTHQCGLIMSQEL